VEKIGLSAELSSANALGLACRKNWASYAPLHTSPFIFRWKFSYIHE